MPLRRWSRMVLLPVLLVLLLVQAQAAIGAQADDDDSTDSKCCELGASWAAQSLSCAKFSGPVAGVDEARQAACLATVDSCCRDASRRRHCQLGKADAKAGRGCATAPTTGRRVAVELKEIRRDCCEGCKLGIQSASNKGCEKKALLNESWGSAFAECCEEKLNTATTRAAISTAKATTSTTATTGDDELAEIFKDITDTTYATQGDLCQLMKGLLCSDICVPTPGSYYCKCRDGSVLQPDGRSCESPSTTAKKTTEKTNKPSTAKSTQKATTKRTTTKATTKRTTTKAPPKTTTTTKALPKTTKDTKNSTGPMSPVTALKLLTRAKTRTTRALTTEDNELNQSCPTGYRLNPGTNTCYAIECRYPLQAPCPLVTAPLCRNDDSNASLDCAMPNCELGYRWNSSLGRCVDRNECSDQGTNPCPQYSICVNTPGGYECKSLVDYSTEPRPLERNVSVDYDAVAEEDIDECEILQQACAQGEICRNTVGGYDCVPAGCHRGFVRDNDTGGCVDVDECDRSLHSCLPDELCRNTNGSYTCEPPRPTPRPLASERPAIVCRKGYKADYQLDGCVDVDECVEGPGCRDHERCINYQGSYDCSPLCRQGWYFDLESKSCQDVDECLLGHHNCRQRTQYCRNTNGSYACEALEACATGYRRSQNGSCADVDECHENLHSCSRESHRYCVNRPGGYECITRLPSCSNGFQYSLLTRDCEDEDECRSGKAACDSRLGERCVNLPGTYKCERPTTRPRLVRPACPSGTRYDVKLRMCADIDECSDGSHNCGEEKCYNLPGSFECAKAIVPVIKRRTSTSTTLEMGARSNGDDNCSAGSKHDTERGGCVDIDECTEIKDACGSYEDCVNTAGSFECRCKRGFRREDLTRACVDVNECLQENDCQSYQRCDNTIGSYSCVRFLSCGTGYTLNAATEICEDDDECLMGTHNCHKGWRCVNTLGNFRCIKDRSTPADKTRTTTWPSKWTTRAYFPSTPRTTTTTYRPPATTTTTTTSTSTTYRSTTTSTTPSTSTQRGTWIATRPTLRPWNTTRRPSPTPRYYPNSTVHVPATTRTTTEFVPTVGPIVTARNRDRTTTRSPMTCPPGYESGSSGQCIDVNECKRNPRICGPFKCTNFMGSYKCEHRMVCPIGHRADPLTGECKDVDECATGHECGPYQTCQNRPGGYFCYCSPGYEIRGKECVEVNECARYSSPSICGPRARCENTPGSYRCTCETGFAYDSATAGCLDLDECASKPNLCEQRCYNTWGGHRCGCNLGYRLRRDNRTCEDTDECREFKDSHLCVGFCENTPGSYACRCPDGYRIAEDGRTCQDIDECATNAVCQGAHEICQNVRGSYRCNRINCPPGYIHDFQRKNRCMRESPFCPAHDTACFNRPAHYTYNYIAIVSMFPIPPSGEVELFVMRGAYNVPGSTVTFSMAFITARASPDIKPATEECFSLNKHYPSQAVLALTKSLQGPQDVELELLMEIYSPNGILAGSAVAKIFIVITRYEF